MPKKGITGHDGWVVTEALATALVAEYGERAPLVESGGRALREMTRIAASPSAGFALT